MTVDVLSDYEKDIKLREVIEEIASSEDYNSKKRYIAHGKILYQIYGTGNYKTKLSEVFSVLSVYFDNKSTEMEAIGLNLENLNSYITLERFGTSTYKGFAELYDYFNLEMGRYSLYKKQLISNSNPTFSDGNEIKAKIKKIENDIEISNSVTSDAKKAMIQVDDKLERNSISSITALSIFSAVILAFSGGFNLATGILNEIAKVSALRLTFICSLLGFILYNTIFMLLYIVAKMTGKNISGHCKYQKQPIESENKNDNSNFDCNYCSKSTGSRDILCKAIHRYTFTFVVNLIFVLIMYYSGCLWLFLESTYYVSCNLHAITPALFYLLPIFTVIMIVLNKFRQILFSTQQKRLYNKYKLKILYNILKIQRKPTRKLTYNLQDIQDKSDNNFKNQTIYQVQNTINNLATTSNIEKLIDNDLESPFNKYILKEKNNSFISFEANLKNKIKIKKLIKMLKSRKKRPKF